VLINGAYQIIKIISSTWFTLKTSIYIKLFTQSTEKVEIQWQKFSSKTILTVALSTSDNGKVFSSFTI